MSTAHVSPDSYLVDFLSDVRQRYAGNLRAVLVYGSYIEGYFDSRESDYDILVFFAEPPDPEHKSALEQKYPKISLLYYLTVEELDERIRSGSWSLYIAVLQGAEVLYQDNVFEQYVTDLSSVDMAKILSTEKARRKLREKFEDEIRILNEREGFEAIKWLVPTLRRILQICTYVQTRETVWGLEDNLKINQNILNDNDTAFIKDVQQRLLHRTTEFTQSDTRRATVILENLSSAVLDELSTQ